MKPLLVYCPEPRDATSFYRAWGPLTQLQDLIPRLQLKSPGTLNWTELFNSSGVFIQRPSTTTHVKICELAKECNKPVWIDWDDNLFEVPTDNLAFHLFYDVYENLYRIMELATVITFSTDAIESYYIKVAAEKGIDISGKCRVVPNALHPNFKIPQEPSKNKTILWRGAPTHMKDLMEYKDAIARVAKARPEWKWVFMGFYPWMLEEELKGKFEFIRPLEIFEYLSAIQKINPSIIMVPLGFNTFNEGKSNIAWIEGALAGAITFGPAMPEWQQYGVVKYTDLDSFEFGLNNLLSQSMSFEALFNVMRDSVPQLAVVNKQRKRLLEEFFLYD